MARLFPSSSTVALRIPVYAGAPNGGDLLSLYVRLFVPTAWSWTGSNFTRIVTRREGAGAGAWTLQGVGTPSNNQLSFQAQYSGSGNIGAWTFPNLATGKWYDVLLAYDYSNWASVPSFWLNGASVTATVGTTPVSGTPNVHLNDVQIGNRLNGLCPGEVAIAELAWWKGRLLGQREANLITAYGPEAVPRARTGWWNLDAGGPTYIASHDGPNPIVPSAGAGLLGFPSAPPRRKRRWFTVPGGLPLAYTPPPSSISGAGSAGEGESASGTASGATIAATGSAGEGESASGSGSVSGGATITGTGTAGEGEGAAVRGIPGAWQGVQTWIDSSRGVALPFQYQVYLPPTWSPTGTPWPVATFLHGSGESGTDGTTQLKDMHIIEGLSALPCIVIAPQLPSTFPLAPYTDYRHAWDHLATVGLPAAIVAQYNGDPTRVSLTGLSLGGERTYASVFEFGRVLAAVAPVSADLQPYADFGSAPDFPTSLSNFTASPGAATPMHIYHAADDGTIPVAQARSISSALIAAGYPCTYTEAPSGSGGHSQTYWDTVYGDITFWNGLTGYQNIPATGAAGEGEGASGTGIVGGTVTGTGSAGEGESITGTGSGAAVSASGSAGEGEGGAGSGTVAESATGAAGQGQGASGSGALTDTGTGSAGQGEGATGTAGGAAASGSGSGGEGSGASGSGSVSMTGTGSAGEGQSASGAGTVFDPTAAHAITLERVYFGPAVRVKRVRLIPQTTS